jgi:hypothetical protein
LNFRQLEENNTRPNAPFADGYSTRYSEIIHCQPYFDIPMSKSRKITYLCILWLIVGATIWSTQSTLVVSKPVAFVPVPMMCLFLAASASVAIWRGKPNR